MGRAIRPVAGSADPFSSPDGGSATSDEGVIPWPAGVAESGAMNMYIAEIEVYASCTSVFRAW